MGIEPEMLRSVAAWGGVGVALACLSSVGAILLYGVYRELGRTAKRVGWVAMSLLGLISVGATISGSPTQEDKERYHQENNAWANALGFGSNGVQNVDGGENAKWKMENVELGDTPIVAPGSAETGILHSAFYTLHSHTNLDWLAFGGYGDWFTVPEGGWCFRFGSNLVERLAVLSCGEISPSPHDASNRISLLGLPLSIVPSANWHLLTPRRSLFWHAETPSNTLLLTWENALVRRDTNLPVTVQAELFPDGAAAFRYDFSGVGNISALSNAEARIWRDGVLAADGITDGGHGLPALPEMLEVDFPAPPTTGTNSLDEVYARIAGGNTNAYYCADVVVSKGPAKIRVEPMVDETNRGLLGAYEIVALPGETNRLPLLIGPRYAVSSEAAFGSFGLVAPPFVPLADGTGTVARLAFGESFSVTNVTDRLVEVQWPVEFALEEIGVTPEATTYGLRVVPDWLGGTVSWSGAPLLRSGGCGTCPCGCRTYGSSTVTVAVSCRCEDCEDGEEGDYEYEGHREHFEESFRKDGDDPAPDDPGGGEDPENGDHTAPSVSLSFSKDVVIFEDRYEDSPGVFVERRSTKTQLTVTAYGGENGGSLELSILGGLVKVAGESEHPSYIGPHSHIQWTAQYEGVSPSYQYHDVVASVVLLESGTFEQYSADAHATIVEIQIEPTVYAPENNAILRHRVGVCERAKCFQTPSVPSVLWSADYGSISHTNNLYRFVAPLHAALNPLHATIGDVSYTPEFTVVEPQGVEARNVRSNCKTNKFGQAGWAGLFLDLYVLPLDVSFSQIAIEEVPCEIGERDGYFSHVDFTDMSSHTRENGAGSWSDVNAANLFDNDDASVDELPRMRWDHMIVTYPDPTVGWLDGCFSWNIPYGWNVRGTIGLSEPVGQFAIRTRHRVEIVPDGTVTLRKLGKTAVRTTNEVISINGVQIR